MSVQIDKKTIESLLPHRKPMLLIDRLTNIVPPSATAIMNVKKDGFYVQVISQSTRHAEVLIVEAWSSCSCDCSRY